MNLLHEFPEFSLQTRVKIVILDHSLLLSSFQLLEKEFPWFGSLLKNLCCLVVYGGSPYTHHSPSSFVQIVTVAVKTITVVYICTVCLSFTIKSLRRYQEAGIFHGVEERAVRIHPEEVNSNFFPPSSFLVRALLRVRRLSVHEDSETFISNISLLLVADRPPYVASFIAM